MADTATGPGTPAPVAEATGISKRFGATVALREARITVAPGESHALVGRNGGKQVHAGVRPHRPPATGHRNPALLR